MAGEKHEKVLNETSNSTCIPGSESIPDTTGVVIWPHGSPDFSGLPVPQSSFDSTELPSRVQSFSSEEFL